MSSDRHLPPIITTQAWATSEVEIWARIFDPMKAKYKVVHTGRAGALMGKLMWGRNSRMPRYQ